jgi:hypothetical protein
VRRATVEATESVNVSVREPGGRPFLAAPDPRFGGCQLAYRPRPRAAPARRSVFVTASFGSDIPGRYVSEMTVGDLPEARYTEACS